VDQGSELYYKAFEHGSVQGGDNMLADVGKQTCEIITGT
jgi:hypothetical protein